MDIFDNDGFKLNQEALDKGIADAMASIAGAMAKNGGEPGTGEAVFTAKEGEPQLTVGYVLQKVEELRADTEYINAAVKELGEMETHVGEGDAPGAPGDIAGKAKAEAIAEIVKYREQTNQKMLLFYENLLYGLTKLRPDDRHKPLPPAPPPPPQKFRGPKELETVEMLKDVLVMGAFNNNPHLKEEVGQMLVDLIRKMSK